MIDAPGQNIFVKGACFFLSSCYSSNQDPHIGRQNRWGESPEIVVEVLSPSNTGDEIRQKRTAVFARGASEFWVCDRKGNLEFFGPRARLAKSRLCPQFPSGIAS